METLTHTPHPAAIARSGEAKGNVSTIFEPDRSYRPIRGERAVRAIFKTGAILAKALYGSEFDMRQARPYQYINDANVLSECGM